VGPWQIPVADVAVTSMGYKTYLGEAFSLGERAPVALVDPAASARMAVGEALTNIAKYADARRASTPAATPGCRAIIRCVASIASCHQPNECAAVCENGFPQDAISQAALVTSCLGGC